MGSPLDRQSALGALIDIVSAFLTSQRAGSTAKSLLVEWLSLLNEILPEFGPPSESSAGGLGAKSRSSEFAQRLAQRSARSPSQLDTDSVVSLMGRIKTALDDHSRANGGHGLENHDAGSHSRHSESRSLDSSA